MHNNDFFLEWISIWFKASVSLSHSYALVCISNATKGKYADKREGVVTPLPIGGVVGPQHKGFFFDAILRLLKGKEKKVLNIISLFNRPEWPGLQA